MSLVKDQSLLRLLNDGTSGHRICRLVSLVPATELVLRRLSLSVVIYMGHTYVLELSKSEIG